MQIMKNYIFSFKSKEKVETVVMQINNTVEEWSRKLSINILSTGYYGSHVLIDSALKCLDHFTSCTDF